MNFTPLIRKHLMYSFLLLFLLPACKSVQEDEPVQTINFSANDFLYQENVSLENITSEIAYIPLETTEESMIQRISDLTVTEEYLIVIDRKKVLVFNHDGEFQRVLARKGRGPEEYLFAFDLLYNQGTGEYILYGYQDYLVFDENLRFLYRKKHSPYQKGLRQLNEEMYCGDFNTDAYPRDSTKYALKFFDTDFNTIGKIEARNTAVAEEGQTPFMVDLSCRIAYAPDKLLFSEPYGDTLFQITEAQTLEPVLVLNYKDQKFDPRLNYDYKFYTENKHKFIKLSNHTLIDNQLVCSFSYENSPMYSYTDVSTDRTVIPYVTLQNQRAYAFTLPVFSDYPVQLFFGDGFFFSQVEAYQARERIQDEHAEAMSANTRTKIEALTEADNPVLVIGFFAGTDSGK